MERSRRFDLSEIEVTHIKGSGPGGQHRNKRMTGVRILHRPTGIVAEATERRSQSQNLENALERLDTKLARYYFRPTPRRKTRPTAASRVRKSEGKRRSSQRKGMRKKVTIDTD